MKGLDNFYQKKEEPTRGTLLALRSLILALNPAITPEWKYGMPFFYYKGKMFCYLWADPKTDQPYIGIVNGHLMENPLLEKGKRKRIKIFRINPNLDLEVDLILSILQESLSLFSY